MYGADTWAAKKLESARDKVGKKMRMLRWMCGVTTLAELGNKVMESLTQLNELRQQGLNKTVEALKCNLEIHI